MYSTEQRAEVDLLHRVLRSAAREAHRAAWRTSSLQRQQRIAAVLRLLGAIGPGDWRSVVRTDAGWLVQGGGLVADVRFDRRAQTFAALRQPIQVELSGSFDGGLVERLQRHANVCCKGDM